MSAVVLAAAQDDEVGARRASYTIIAAMWAPR
jgi:hypothetical protein